MTTDLIHAYTRNRSMIDQVNKQLRSLREEERNILADIASVLNDAGAPGVRIDERKTLQFRMNDKKILLKPNDYRQNVARLLRDIGVEYVDDEMIDALIDARVGDTVKMKRLRVVKSKIQK